MSVGTTNEPRTRPTSRRGWPVAIALAGSLLAGAVVFQVSGIAAPEKTSVQRGCTSHRLDRHGDHDRLSHSGKALQGRPGVHPEYRQTHSVHGLHECEPIPRSRVVPGELRSQCDRERLEVRDSEARHQSRRCSQSQVLAHGHPNQPPNLKPTWPRISRGPCRIAFS